MLIKIHKEMTIQIQQFEPVTFSYSLEEENGDIEKMEKTIDDLLEKESVKWLDKKNNPGNAVKSIRERGPF
jgi:hypothetical protein